MARYWREDSSLFWAHICLILLVNGAKMESRDIGFYYHYSPPPLLLVSLYGSYGGLFTFPAHEACRKLFYLGHYKALTEGLRENETVGSPFKWRWPKSYTMIIPPMGGDHFGMGPRAQRSSVAELAISRFFSYKFCFAPHDPIFGTRKSKCTYTR